MKLLPKFALLSIGVAAVPLAIAGYSSIRVSQAALRDAIEGHEVLLARQISEYVTSHLSNLQSTMSVETRILDLTRVGGALPTAQALRKFLQLVYHQSDDFSVVALLDTEGQTVVPAAFQSVAPRNDSFGTHEIVSAEDVAQLPGHVPVEAVLREGSAVGSIFVAGHAHVPHVVLAVRYQGVPDEDPRIIVAAVSLRRIADHLASLSSVDTDILLLDRESRTVASGRALGAARPEPKRLPQGKPGSLPPEWFVAEYPSHEHAVIGAYVPALTFGLGVVVERWVESALRPARRLTWTTIYWVGVAAFVAAVVGAALARSLATRVGTLVQGARHIAQGKLDAEIEVASNDELGELAKAFNSMASSLSAARSEILLRNEEIRGWNVTLEKRVEDKTKELRDAQDLLLRSRSLAAIGSLGAGVAHEINNPLTGVLGLAQILLSDLPEGHPARPLIKDIEEQAARIQGIVANLLRFSQKQSGEHFRPFDLGEVVGDALELCGAKSLADAGIAVVKRIPSPGPPIRGSALQVQAALIQLIQNARAAMDSGGTLTLETTQPDDKLLRLRVSDTGHGIKPEQLSRIFDPFFTTKAQRTDTGIGLSMVHKIIEDHGATIRVESQVGLGTTFWLTFPIAEGASLLA
ncbi:MAG: ATP-binding protein [Polyangia bacterium]